MSAKKMNIKESDFGKSTRRRLPICFCLDVSGSMSGQPMQHLNEGLHSFFSSIRENDETRAAADISIVTFGGHVDIHMPFGKISPNQSAPVLRATTGLTPMGEGILVALELLAARKEGYKHLGIKYFQPWLVVITDGAPQGEKAIENMQRAIYEVRTLESKDRLVVFNIGVGSGVDKESLKELSGKRSEPISITSAQFGKLFEFLGSSSSSVVSGTLKDDLLYDMEAGQQGQSLVFDEFVKHIEGDE